MRWVLAFLVGILAVSTALAEGNAKKGQKLSETHCARCHVVGDFNKFGGIGSTPSFNLLVGMKDGTERFRNFYERRPHPAFITVPNVPRWTKLAPYATPFEVTSENIEDVLAFVRTLEAKRLQVAPTGGSSGRREGRIEDGRK